MSGPFDRWLAAVPVSNSLTTEQVARAQSARIAAEVTRISGLTSADMDDLIAVAEWVMTGEFPEEVEDETTQATAGVMELPRTLLWDPATTFGGPVARRGGMRFSPEATVDEPDEDPGGPVSP